MMPAAPAVPPAPTVAQKTRLITLVMAIDLIIALFLLDQASKWYVLEHIIAPMTTDTPLPPMGFFDWLMALSLPRLPFAELIVLPFFNLVMVWNEGISFGVFGGHNGAGNIALISVLLAIVIGFTIWMWRTPSVFLRFTLAAVIGGAIGNLWDRVRFGAVADFLDFHYAGWHYPAFNVADSCIVVGILALVVYELICGGGKSRTPSLTEKVS